MLDEEDGEVELIAYPADHLHELLRFLRVHPRRRLVEEEELWLRGERPRDFEAALRPVGEIFCCLRVTSIRST